MRLVLILALAINLFLVLSLVFFKATRKTYPGFGPWTAGVSLLGLGYLSFCLRGLIPDSISILVANAAFPLGMVLHLAGMRLFLGLSPISRRWYALPGGVLAAAAVFYFGYDLEAWRTLIVSIAISVPHFVMAFLILRQPVTPRSMFYGVIGSLLAMAGVMILGRGIWSLSEPQFHVFLHSPVQFIFFVSMVVLQLGETLAFMMLNSERVEGELVEAKTELIMTVSRLQEALAEQKRVEESLRDSEERYRTFFDTSRDCVFMTTLDGRFTDFNDVGLEILGYSPSDRQEMMRKNVASFYANPEEREAHKKRVATLGFSKDYPVDFRKQDGTIIHTLVTTVARKDLQGTIIGFQGIVRDITERKKAEDELRESEERFRMIYESGMLGMGFCDLDGRVLDANDTYLAMIRRSREDLLNNRINWREITPAEHLPADLNAFDELMTTGRCTPYEKEYLLPDGTRVPVVIGGALISGSSSTAIAFALDITERKQAEEALRASEEKYRLLVDKAQEAIFVVQDTVFRFVNPRLEEIAGFSADELIGNSFGGFVHPDDRETVIEKHYRRLKGDVFPSRYEIRIIDKQNRVKWVEIDSVVIDWEGKPAAMVFLTDISYRKLAEEAAVQTERLKAIADLSGGVAHHFNNLLQIVIGNTSLSLADLESGDLSEVKTNLEQMLEAATLGAETVRRLQTFANIRADITKEEAAIFDIAATARSAAEVSEPLWKSDPEKERIKIDLHLHLEDGCLVKGQKNEMFEVLVNLMINAAEAMPDGGDIEVKTYREPNEVLITVCDTGSGIAEENLPRVFEPFWSSKGVGIGKGMGLAVTHGLVKRHGGTINVQSEVGKGSTFTIRLPLAQEPIRKTEEPATRPADRKLTILVIEDDERIATLLEMIFVDAGHSAFKALSGGEGLAIFNKEPVDLVICDLGMPGMNGWDVGKAIRSVSQEKGITKPPFVLLTGWGGQELEREKIAESGTDAVVAKPIDPAALLATVQKIAARDNINSLEK